VSYADKEFMLRGLRVRHSYGRVRGNTKTCVRCGTKRRRVSSGWEYQLVKGRPFWSGNNPPCSPRVKPPSTTSEAAVKRCPARTGPGRGCFGAFINEPDGCGNWRQTRRCFYCSAFLAIAPAADNSPQVHVEMRAAELACRITHSPRRLFIIAQYDSAKDPEQPGEHARYLAQIIYRHVDEVSGT
jgi:hypothetical protein